MAVSHVLSATTPDDPAFEIRPSHWNSVHAQLLTISGNTAGQSTFSGTNLVFSGGPNATLSINGNTLVFSGGAGAAGNTGFIEAGTTNASLGTVVFSNSNGVSFGVDGQTVTASHNGLTSQSNQAVSAANGSYAFQTLSFSNANGVSFGTSAGSAVTASYTVPTVPAQLSVGNSNLGNTAGDTGVFTGRVVFVGSDNITLSGSSNAGSATISLIGAAGGGGLTNIRVSAGTTSNLLSAVTFADSNGISFGLDASTITASHNGLTSQSNQAVSADNGSYAFQTLSFSNANGISFGTSAGSAVTASHNALTSQSNQAASGSNGSFTFQTLTFGNLNGLSFYTSNGSIVGSYTDGGGAGGAYSAGISTQGNTAGTTGFATSGLQLVGSQNITLSQSTGANGTITILGPNAPIIRNYANLDNGAEGSASAAMTCASQSNATLWVFPFAGPQDVFPGRMSLDRFGILHSNSFTVTGTSQAHTSSISVAFYTQVNATQLSRVVSGSRSWNLTANANNTQSYNGARWFTFQSADFNAQPTFSNTSYWCALWMRTSGTAHTASMGPAAIRRGMTHISGLMGSASSTANSYAQIPFHGYYSASFTTAMPDTVALSDMVCTGSGWGQMIPYVAAQASDHTGGYGIW